MSLRQNGALIWGTEPVVCGDGVVGGSEACDDHGESATCDKDCTAPACGDGVLNTHAGEGCDTAISSNCLAGCAAYPTGQACINGSLCLKAQARAGSLAPTDNQIVPQFILTNNSDTTIPLSELKIRYWFTREHSGAAVSGLQAACNWAALDCGTITQAFFNVSPARADADTYLEVGLTGTGTLAPGATTGEIQLRFNWNDWVNFNEIGDHSYPAATTYADRTEVTVYRNGQIIWGVEP